MEQNDKNQTKEEGGEKRVVGPLTMRQFLLLVSAGAVSQGLFFVLSIKSWAFAQLLLLILVIRFWRK